MQPRAGASIEIATFYNVYDDLRSQEPPASGAPFPITLANKLNAETWGAELNLNLEPAPWWRLHGSYTYFHKELSLDPGSRDPSGGIAEGNDPEHRLALRSYWTCRAASSSTPGCATSTGCRSRPSRPTPSSTCGWAGGRPDRLELSLVGQNLLHSQHAEFRPRPCRKEVERSVYGRATWRF